MKILMDVFREVEVYFMLYFVYNMMDYELYKYCVYHLFYRREHEAIEYLNYLIKNRYSIVYNYNI